MKLHRSIYKVLQAFAMFRPDIGYVQGMSYLAGVILMYSEDEIDEQKSF